MIQEQKYNFAQIKSGTRKVSLSTKQSSSATDKKIVARSGTMSDTDFTTFINKLADNLSITLTPDKIKYFQAQRAVENTRAKNNPFATTWPGGKRDTWSADPNMTRFNSVGVKNFSNMDLLNALRGNEDMAKKIYEPGVIIALNKWGGGSYAPKIQSRYKSVRDTIPIKDKTDKPSAETEIDVDNNKGKTTIGGKFKVDLENGPANHRSRAAGNWQSDNAWDLFAPAGTPVNSYTIGRVKKIYNTNQRSGKVYGTQVTIEGDEDYPDIFYTHLKNVKLKVGNQVGLGDYIGEICEWEDWPQGTHVHIGLPYGNHLNSLTDDTKKDTIDLSLTDIRSYEKRLRFYSNVIYKAYDYWFDRLNNWKFGYDYYSPTEVANYIASTYNKKWLNNPDLLASLTETIKSN